MPLSPLSWKVDISGREPILPLHEILESRSIPGLDCSPNPETEEKKL